MAREPTWGSSARTRSLRTGARRFIVPAAWALRGARGGWGAPTRPGDPRPRRPDDHPRPRRPDDHSGPRRAFGSPRPRGRDDHCGPRRGHDHPRPGRAHDHPGPGRPEDHSGPGRFLRLQRGAGRLVGWGPGPRRTHDNAGPDRADDDPGPRSPDDRPSWRRPDHHTAARGRGAAPTPGSEWPDGAARPAGCWTRSRPPAAPTASSVT